MSRDIAIDARGVWKIFGDRATEALEAIHRDGPGKSEVLSKFGCVVGVADDTFQIEDVMGLNAERLRHLRNHRVAMVFQNFGLMPHRTVRDNVAMPLEVRGASKARRWAEADRVLDLVDLTGWEDKYAHELSGGMQQRVGLARALASNPQILLMDLCVEGAGVVRVVADGKTVGVINRSGLIRAIRENRGEGT